MRNQGLTQMMRVTPHLEMAQSSYDSTKVAKTLNF